MKIYKDLWTNDEIFTDTVKFETLDNGLFKIPAHYRNKDGGIDDSLIGGNKSEESPGDEGADDVTVKVLDIVDNCCLTEIQAFSKKELKVYLKSFVQLMLAKLEEKESCESTIKNFKLSAAKGAKFLMEHHKDLQLFAPQSGDVEHSLMFLHWEEGASVPVGYVFKDALYEEKL